MLIAPEGRFILVNMDRCQDLMGEGGGLLEHVTPVPLKVHNGNRNSNRNVLNSRRRVNKVTIKRV